MDYTVPGVTNVLPTGLGNPLAPESPVFADVQITRRRMLLSIQQFCRHHITSFEKVLGRLTSYSTLNLCKLPYLNFIKSK